MRARLFMCIAWGRRGQWRTAAPDDTLLYCRREGLEKSSFFYGMGVIYARVVSFLP